MSARIYQVVTFSREPFGGNPAFVVALDALRPLSVLQQVCQQLQQQILAVLWEMNDELHLRYVTPNGAQSAPGHATQAAAWVAFNKMRQGADRLALRLEDGHTRTVRRKGDVLSVDWPTIPFEPSEVAPEIVAQSLGQKPNATFNSSFGLVAVFDYERQIENLVPDRDKLLGMDASTIIATAPANTADFAIRVFAPKLGLDEDPVCGTAHRVLSPYWAASMGRDKLVSHQLSPRGGTLICELKENIVTISGDAISFLDGSIDLPSGGDANG